MELPALLTQDEVDPLAAGIFGASDEERRKRIVQNDPTHYDNALWLANPDLNHCRATEPRSSTIRRTGRFLR